MKKALLMAAAGGALISTAPALAQGTNEEEMNKAIEAFIMENPEVILRSVEEYQVRQQAEMLEKSKEEARAFMGQVKNSDDYPVVGPEDADVTIVEFFDYNCGYCKKAAPIIDNLIEGNDDLRVVFIEFPILGPTSALAAKWALAADNQGKYYEYHDALMNSQGQKTEAVLRSLAEKAGLDADQLAKDAAAPEIEQKIAANIELARSMGLSGTPAFIIGDEVIRGFVPQEGMEQAIKAARMKQQDES